MVERLDRSVLTLFSRDSFAAGGLLRLDGDAARHARARRVRVGDTVRVLDGKGRIGDGGLDSLGKNAVTVSVAHVVDVPRPPGLEVIVPVADRDRMLLAAEKAVELQITAWRPAYFARSRSVSPRGEGEKFRDKVVARMQAALEQSGGAWMPDVHVERDASEVMRSTADVTRLVLDAEGRAIASVVGSGPIALAIGPEGGLEEAELDAAQDAGWIRASLGPSTLRFETAVIAGIAVIRAMQLSNRSG